MSIYCYCWPVQYTFNYCFWVCLKKAEFVYLSKMLSIPSAQKSVFRRSFSRQLVATVRKRLHLNLHNTVYCLHVLFTPIVYTNCLHFSYKSLFKKSWVYLFEQNAEHSEFSSAKFQQTIEGHCWRRIASKSIHNCVLFTRIV